MFVRDFFVGGGTPWGEHSRYDSKAGGIGMVATMLSRCGLWQLPQP